jgi:hypothetical protein
VTIVVFVFLQNIRATIIPLITIPVSLVGTFIFFPLLGFSVNTLSMFGLVLAIGIVVDDAIVVVEAVIHHLEHGLPPKEATIKAMSEVSGPVIGIALILSAVFVPVALLGGLVGSMYKQFALTIAISVLLSAFNALSLTPALCALMLSYCAASQLRSDSVAPFKKSIPLGCIDESSVQHQCYDLRYVGNVVQWAFVEHHDVGQGSRRNEAQLALETQRARRVQRHGPKCLGRRHTSGNRLTQLLQWHHAGSRRRRSSALDAPETRGWGTTRPPGNDAVQWEPGTHLAHGRDAAQRRPHQPPRNRVGGDFAGGTAR